MDNVGTFLITILKILFIAYFLDKGLDILIENIRHNRKHPREKITITQKDNQVILRHSDEIDREFWAKDV